MFIQLTRNCIGVCIHYYRTQVQAITSGIQESTDININLVDDPYHTIIWTTTKVCINYPARACAASGKVCLSVCCQLKNREISRSRKFEGLESTRIRQNRQNSLLHYIMLLIVWQGPRVSETLHFCWPHLSTVPCMLSVHAHNLTSYVGKGR
jgi:hypothetical protein